MVGRRLRLRRGVAIRGGVRLRLRSTLGRGVEVGTGEASRAGRLRLVEAEVVVEGSEMTTLVPGGSHRRGEIPPRLEGVVEGVLDVDPGTRGHVAQQEETLGTIEF